MPHIKAPKVQSEQEKTVQEIANNIKALAESVETLLKGPVNRKALLILLAHSAKLTQSQVAAVLDALIDLKKDYLN